MKVLFPSSRGWASFLRNICVFCYRYAITNCAISTFSIFFHTKHSDSSPLPLQVCLRQKVGMRRHSETANNSFLFVVQADTYSFHKKSSRILLLLLNLQQQAPSALSDLSLSDRLVFVGQFLQIILVWVNQLGGSEEAVTLVLIFFKWWVLKRQAFWKDRPKTDELQDQEPDWRAHTFLHTTTIAIKIECHCS